LEVEMSEEEIRRLCEAEGLLVSQIQQMDQILVLMPRSLDALPDVDALAGLSERICAQSDYRYVTLGIDGVIFGDDALKPQERPL
jgi:hypothetical protein